MPRFAAHHETSLTDRTGGARREILARLPRRFVLSHLAATHRSGKLMGNVVAVGLLGRFGTLEVDPFV